MSVQKKIGISGGIGSGKSFVCALLEKKGFPVYYADPRAKYLMENDPLVREELILAFGSETFANNQLNKSFIAQLIFNNEQHRKRINSIVHPAVYRDFNSWAEQQETPLVFQESALIFDTGSYTRFDATILVDSPINLRIARIVKRDGSTEEQAMARISSQGDFETHKLLANYVINNDEQQDLESQIESIIGELYSTSS